MKLWSVSSAHQFPVASVVKGDESSLGCIGLTGAVPHILVSNECAVHSLNLVCSRGEGGKKLGGEMQNFTLGNNKRLKHLKNVCCKVRPVQV